MSYSANKHFFTIYEVGIFMFLEIHRWYSGLRGEFPHFKANCLREDQPHGQVAHSPHFLQETELQLDVANKNLQMVGLQTGLHTSTYRLYRTTRGFNNPVTNCISYN